MKRFSRRVLVLSLAGAMVVTLLVVRGGLEWWRYVGFIAFFYFLVASALLGTALAQKVGRMASFVIRVLTGMSFVFALLVLGPIITDKRSLEEILGQYSRSPLVLAAVVAGLVVVGVLYAVPNVRLAHEFERLEDRLENKFHQWLQRRRQKGQG